MPPELATDAPSGGPRFCYIAITDRRDMVMCSHPKLQIATAICRVKHEVSFVHRELSPMALASRRRSVGGTARKRVLERGQRLRSSTALDVFVILQNRYQRCWF